MTSTTFTSDKTSELKTSEIRSNTTETSVKGIKFVVTFENQTPVISVCRPKSVVIKSQFFKQPFRSTYYENITPKN